ncbi:MAG: hypothetical protein IJ231_07710 [Clostridia bacterium]|nr:hypothetical protein [Clostridia bacterium]
MYCTWLPEKGSPSMAVTEAGIRTASAAMPWKASASMAVRAAGRVKVEAGAARTMKLIASLLLRLSFQPKHKMTRQFTASK